MPDTGTMNGRLVAAHTDEGWIAAIAWNDPGTYPADGKGVETKVYTHPFPLMATAVACAAGQWSTEMAMAGKSDCTLFVGAPESGGSKSCAQLANAYLIYGMPDPSCAADPQKIRRDAALQALAEKGYGDCLIRCHDGALAASPLTAVKKFRCPGPCSPDCPLFQIVRLANGEHRRLCDEASVKEYPAEALLAIGAEYVKDRKGDAK